MAERPRGTWVAQIFNFLPNNGLPIGFVDVVYNRDGSIAGYEVDGKFFKIGQKAKGEKSKTSTDPRKFGSDFAASVAAKSKEMDKKREEALAAVDRINDEKTRSQLRAEINNKQNYIETLRKSLPNYEGVIERYALKVARGDELDALEQDELKVAQSRYSSVMNTIQEVQQDIFTTLYPGQKKKSDVEKTPLASAGPTGTAATAPTSATTPSPAQVQTPSLTPSQTPSQTPSGDGRKKDKQPQDQPPAIVPSAGFNPARFRMGEEASMGAAKPSGIGEVATGKRTLEDILGDVQNYFDLPDYIFRLDKDLGDLLVLAVNEKWTINRWDKEIELTNWWRKNNANVRQRLISFGNYEDLRSQGQDVSKSDYGLWLSKKKGTLKADARNIAGVTLTDQQSEEIAKKIYLGFLDDDENAIRAFLVPFISQTTSIVGGKPITGYGGQALKNYQTLQSIAKANGLSLRDILPGISAATTDGNLEEAVLEKLALGELDINRISQDARIIAGTGQPEFVRNLLNQGYDLEQIYSPYKGVMASVLELNPEEIDLKELSGYGLFSDKGQSNIYDFKKALRKDSRWQYTNTARTEVSNSAFQVLRDFGFQG